jgi:hypothetical protein
LRLSCRHTQRHAGVIEFGVGEFNRRHARNLNRIVIAVHPVSVIGCSCISGRPV